MIYRSASNYLHMLHISSSINAVCIVCESKHQSKHQSKHNRLNRLNRLNTSREMKVLQTRTQRLLRQHR